MKITVITADIISSRRATLEQKQLHDYIAAIGHQQLLIPFTPSRGDEIQGVMKGWLSAPELVRMLRWRCRPLELRIGLGLGLHRQSLATDPWKLNGPAFFRARQALDSQGKDSNPSTQIATGCQHLDAVVNSTWLLLDTIQSRWTSGQWEAVMTYEKVGTLAAAGKKLGVAPQNVHKRCSAAHWNQIRQAEQGLRSVHQLATACNPESGEKHLITPKQVRRC